ncbi:MAG: hypothetical protein A2076_02275 [Geobacteraceae bacterium GWC2_53_11]|nr:MAG: hypothetical protein A2076_02275 [Geobacteraceae bacterium GWC2_53_11]
MPEPNEQSELHSCLKELSKKLDVPRKKDLWDKLPIITTFLGTAVIGVLTLVLTQSYQRLESNRQEKFQAAQIATQKSQIRIEELKAITSLAPLLASKDPSTRDIGKQLLRAVSESKLSDFDPESSYLSAEPVTKSLIEVPAHISLTGSTSKAQQFSLIDKFAQIALTSNESTSRRVEATKEIGKIADGATTPREVKERAVNAVTTIALSADTPEEVRRTASVIVASIKSVSPEQFAAVIAKDRVTRNISEIILHHTVEPSITTYKGPESIFRMAEMQMKTRNWSKISWHYAVSPDGMIWMGMPVNEQTSHAAKRNFDSVSVLLVIDGDKETPTESQKRALGILLRDLLNKFHLSAEENFTDQKGFHRNYYGKTCPGNNITKELVINCIKAAKRSD